MADAATADILHPTVLGATGARARIARVYADALYQAATQAGQADQVADELDAVVGSSIQRHPAVEAFFASTAVTKAAKLPVLAAAFETRASDVFKKFLGVLNQNGRLDLLSAICAEYRKLRDTAGNRVRVAVRAAVPLSPDQVTKLEATLKSKLNATPVVTVTVDPDLLGGLVVRVGDTVYDTSVKTKLDDLRTHLLASGPHG